MKNLPYKFLRFGIVGGIAFLIDYGLLMVLSQVLRFDPVFSAGISFCISLIFNYVASMRYVFERREELSRSREFLTFIGLSFIGLAINELVMYVGVHIFGSSALVVTFVKTTATAIVMVWNYWSRAKWLDASEQ